MRGIVVTALALLIWLGLNVSVFTQTSGVGAIEDETKSTEWPEFYVPAPNDVFTGKTRGTYYGIATITLEHMIESGVCPKVRNIFHRIQYPTNTGNDEIDQQLGEYAYSAFNFSSKLNYKNWLPDDTPESCKSLGIYARIYNNTYFVLSKPSERYLSVLFYWYASERPVWGYKAFNFNLANGQALNLPGDLFLNSEKGLWDFIKYESERFCQKYPGLWKCGDEEGEYYSDGCTGEYVLTGKGLTIVCGPYDGGPLGAGNKILEIPKADLIKLGADPTFWEN